MEGGDLGRYQKERGDGKEDKGPKCGSGLKGRAKGGHEETWKAAN